MATDLDIARERIAECIRTQNSTLDLTRLQTSELPGIKSELEWVTELNLNGTNILEIGFLPCFPQLTSLNLVGTRVSDLSALQHVPQLISLDLSWTKIIDLSALKYVPQLTSLYLSGKQVVDLSPLQYVPKLTSLYLSGAQVIDLSVLQYVPELTSLYLGGTQVNDLSVLQYVPQLTSLDLSGGQDGNLSALQHVPQLTSLNLRESQLSDLSGMPILPCLTSLDLGESKLSDLFEMPVLPCLTSLDLRESQLNDLLGMPVLPQLTSLDLRESQLNDLLGMPILPQLISLNLSDTQISDLSALQYVSQLTSLDLSGTHVSDLSAFQHVPQLASLDLSWTQISDLSALQYVPQLTSLDLSWTQISDLSALQYVPQLAELYLQGCRLTDFPAELSEGTDNCLPNYRAWQKDLALGAKRNRLFKLQICGNGTVGKTKIAERILTGAFTEAGQSTHGIRIQVTPEEKSWVEGHEPIRLMIWDFGGQEVYHQTHRLFLRNRSVFFLVFDADTLTADSQSDPITGAADANRSLSYWISDIYARAPEAGVILVQNKVDSITATQLKVADQIPAGIDYQGPLYISAKSGFRFPELLQALHSSVAELKSYKMQIPASWWRVREALLRNQQVGNKRKRWQISIELFNRLCRLHRVCAGSETALLTYLDGLGVMLYDEQLFPQQIILDQQWALNAVYMVLERFSDNQELTPQQEQIKRFQDWCRRSNGQFSLRDLRQCFDRQRYTDNEVQLFLQIMDRTGICFKTNAKDRREDSIYTLFHFLPESIPPPAEGIAALITRQAAYYQRYVNRYHLHRDIFRQLVKRIKDHVQLDHLWQDGLVLRWHEDTYAILTTDYREQYIQVATSGPAKAAALQAFQNELDDILSGESFFERQVSSDGELFFSVAAIREGKEAEAKKVRDATGVLRADWEELGWCLSGNDEIRFRDQAPKVAHENQVVAAGSGAEDRRAQLEEIRWLINKSRIPEACAALKAIAGPDYRDDLDAIESRYQRNKREANAGRLSVERMDLVASQTNGALLGVLGELERQEYGSASL